MLDLSKWVQVVKDGVRPEDIAEIEKRLGNGEQFDPAIFVRPLDENEQILFVAAQLEKYHDDRDALIVLLINHFVGLLNEPTKQKVNLFVVEHGFRLTGYFDQQLYDITNAIKGRKCFSLAMPLVVQNKTETRRVIDDDFSTASVEQAIQKVFDTGGFFTDNGNGYFVPVDKNGKPFSFGTGDICQQFPKTLLIIRLIEKYAKVKKER